MKCIITFFFLSIFFIPFFVFALGSLAMSAFLLIFIIFNWHIFVGVFPLQFFVTLARPTTNIQFPPLFVNIKRLHPFCFTKFCRSFKPNIYWSSSLFFVNASTSSSFLFLEAFRSSKPKIYWSSSLFRQHQHDFFLSISKVLRSTKSNILIGVLPLFVNTSMKFFVRSFKSNIFPLVNTSTSCSVEAFRPFNLDLSLCVYPRLNLSVCLNCFYFCFSPAYFIRKATLIGPRVSSCFLRSYDPNFRYFFCRPFFFTC